MPTTNPFEDDHLREECAVFGVYGHVDAAAHVALGLHALQHRGQEAAGIVSFDGRQFHAHRGMGLVSDIFANSNVIGRLKGSAAVGHTRYSTTGELVLRNVQPLFAEFEFGGMAIAHNGNLTNARLLRQDLIRHGAIFQSTTDTEIFNHLIANERGGMLDRVVRALNTVEGAYSLIQLTKDGLIGVRDPLGVRPLQLGKLDGSWMLASESCAFDIIGAEFVRDIKPGELVIINDDGVQSHRISLIAKSRFCIFEYIYFARPDSVIEGKSVYAARKEIGAELARESHIDADMVIPVPDSGVPAALGYAQESGIPFELGIIRNHYVGRTFIEPTDEIRHLGVKLKHNANADQIKGKRVILVDDSIVRGTTSKKIVEMVRNAGATEVHMRISSPPTAHSCFYGVDTPEREKLLAANLEVEGIREQIGVDSLAYISLEGLYRAVGEESRNSGAPQYCDACFSGEYPIALKDQMEGDDHPQLSLLAELG
ncbi:MAG: amidophosphoribosyltransferase [Proteobacteria bacterium]|nr:amidophosphoribosyltransferase [Pseudomonadota bacterium]